MRAARTDDEDRYSRNNDGNDSRDGGRVGTMRRWKGGKKAKYSLNTRGQEFHHGEINEGAVKSMRREREERRKNGNTTR